jgi:DNA repair exonuclease SbcCD ATPase subunit
MVDILTPELKLEIIDLIDDRISKRHITREDFSALRDIIKELAEAQKKTEQRVEELAEAQRDSGKRLDKLEVVVTELAEAQKRTEQRVEELAEAQRDSGKRLDKLEVVVTELAEAQKRTEQRVEELAEAQKRTEQEVRLLVRTVKNVQRELGGISNTIGYNLEDQAYKALPLLLKKDFGLEVEGRLIRKFIEYPDGGRDEVNIYGKGRQDGKEFYIIGEAKAQLSKKSIDNLLKLIQRLHVVISADIFPLAVTYSAIPEVERYAAEKGVKLYLSYEF